MQIKSAKDLIVYQKAYALAMQIFAVSKRFPPRKGTHLFIKFGVLLVLSAQTCEKRGRNVDEAHFVSKLTDADGENGETETWLDFARDCGYLPKDDHGVLVEKRREIGAILGSMINDPSSFVLKPISDL
jgi:23S rRNA-intervening sequence protein